MSKTLAVSVWAFLILVFGFVSDFVLRISNFTASAGLAVLAALVTYEGKPLTEGRITFHNAEKGVFITRNLDAGGRFVMQTAKGNGLPVGSYQISIHPPRVEVPFDVMPRGAPEKEYPDIPAKYRDPKTSGFTAEVHGGNNPEFHFEMKGAGVPAPASGQ